MRTFLAAAAALAVSSTLASAGPTDPSSFDPVHYEAQKALYDFDFDNPADGERALGFIRNHIAAAKEFGDFKNSKFVVVAHGNELNAFSRLNRSAYPDVYKHVKELADQGVEFHICRNAAREPRLPAGRVLRRLHRRSGGGHRYREVREPGLQLHLPGRDA